MNKTLLYTALLTIFCTGGYADTTTTTSTTSSESTTLQTPQQTPKESSIPAPGPAPVIDCLYRIPAETTTIEQSVLTTWSEKAVVQSFDFNPATIDDQLVKLKACFTDQGWQSFNDALQKSGNLNAIKSQKLTVSSQTDGALTISPVKENQWKVVVPVQVVYQNDKEKLTQLLSIDLLVGRKISGDLGIMRITATPLLPAGAKPATTTDATQGSAPATPDQAPADEQQPPASTQE